ncbi:MAG TPA: lipopolysaccharide transport periplasmic protein LptA [Desulfuromonadales bacterium]|nr:lipopolysaccharide transport periplasmic protein LptA [Desulfuromonadales bacterium]
MNLIKRLCLCLMVLLTSFCLAAAEPEPTGAGAEDTVKISADRLEADDVASRLTFIGNAVARQGDISIAADQLTISYRGEERQIQSIVAEGHVRIEQGGRTATAERAVYDKPAERITLTGSPTVRQAANSVSGQEIVLFLDGQRSIVKGGSNGRVRAVFQPQSGETP